MTGGPFQRLKATDRTSGRDHPRDAELFDEFALGVDHIANRDDWEAHRVGAAGKRIDRCWAGAPLAATEEVRAEDEVAVRVDRLAGPDQRRPPATLAGRLAVPSQGM